MASAPGAFSPTRKYSSALFRVGLLLYAVSFVLAAIVGTNPARGYWCALYSLDFAVDDIKHRIAGRSPYLTYNLFESFSLLVSALINVFFLFYVLISRFGREHWIASALRLSVPLMIPFCWVVLYYENLHPREGHFLWILGMLLVLFPDKIASMSSARHSSISF